MARRKRALSRRSGRSTPSSAEGHIDPVPGQRGGIALEDSLARLVEEHEGPGATDEGVGPILRFLVGPVIDQKILRPLDDLEPFRSLRVGPRAALFEEGGELRRGDLLSIVSPEDGNLAGGDELDGAGVEIASIGHDRFVAGKGTALDDLF